MRGLLQAHSARIETAAVASILAVTAYLSGSSFRDWSSALAVLLSFICSQIAFDMAESQNQKTGGCLPADNRYRRFYLAKEAWWIVTCIALGSYPLLVSTGVFASYPFWRKLLRSRPAVMAEREDPPGMKVVAA